MTELKQQWRRYGIEVFQGLTASTAEALVDRLEAELGTEGVRQLDMFFKTNTDDSWKTDEPYSPLYVFLVNLKNGVEFYIGSSVVSLQVFGRKAVINLSEESPPAAVIEKIVEKLDRDGIHKTQISLTRRAETTMSFVAPGFHQAAEFKKDALIHGEWRDIIILERLHPSWNQQLGQSIDIEGPTDAISTIESDSKSVPRGDARSTGSVPVLPRHVQVSELCEPGATNGAKRGKPAVTFTTWADDG